MLIPDRLRDITRRALVAFPLEEDLRQLNEEACELAAAVNQFKRGKLDKLGLALEAWDCLIMIARVAAMVGHETWDEAGRVKLNKAEAYVSEQERAMANSPAAPCLIQLPQSYTDRFHGLVAQVAEQMGESIEKTQRLAELTLLQHGMRGLEASIEQATETTTRRVG